MFEHDSPYALKESFQATYSLRSISPSSRSRLAAGRLELAALPLTRRGRHLLLRLPLLEVSLAVLLEGVAGLALHTSFQMLANS